MAYTSTWKLPRWHKHTVVPPCIRSRNIFKDFNVSRHQCHSLFPNDWLAVDQSKDNSTLRGPIALGLRESYPSPITSPLLHFQKGKCSTKKVKKGSWMGLTKETWWQSRISNITKKIKSVKPLAVMVILDGQKVQVPHFS